MDAWGGEEDFGSRMEVNDIPARPARGLEMIEGKDEFPLNSRGTLFMQDQMGNWAIKGEYVHDTSERVYYQIGSKELIISRRAYHRFLVIKDEELSQLDRIFGPATGGMN